MPHGEEHKKKKKKLTLSKAIRTVVPLGAPEVKPPSIEEQRVAQGLPATPQNATAFTPQDIADTERKFADAAFRKKKDEEFRVFRNEKGEIIGGSEGGKGFGFGRDPQDVRDILAKREAAIQPTPTGAVEAGTSAIQRQQQIETQQLLGQVGQFDPNAITPTGLDFGEAATTGFVSAIPRALGLAAGAAILFGGGTAATGVGLPAAPAVAAAAGVTAFVGSIGGSILSNFRSQRTDTTNAQQRVLDEGKQNLNDWITLAAQDPANRITYLKNFNQQLALIDEANRQMILDTKRDIAKFETAVPNRAEFITFYSLQGERDFLRADMDNALINPSNPDYRIMELGLRRGKK